MCKVLYVFKFKFKRFFNYFSARPILFANKPMDSTVRLLLYFRH